MTATSSDKTTQPISIVRIESAINAWREVHIHASIDDDYALDSASSCLAEVYGSMIFHGESSVEIAALTADQRDALLATEI
ncbi:DUF3717 domain-containing protein [Burkholderia plantarii]|uniref:DUF3717 domain-containing protein n=1 Tax=Burkholderia plantarii TaxID=41899 RepID=UPI0018DE7FBA|nr:DUF3717 domain-containing protein [Burkholderia plantarii]MBI0330446.1 DUF3717 domain-containing protein [Burkholderia plantarii]